MNVCYDAWVNEPKKWTDFKDLRVVILHGKDKEKNLKLDADIYCINPEGLRWLIKPEVQKMKRGFRVAVDAARFASFGFDTLCIDELTKFKHTDTILFKVFKWVVPTFKRRWGLTGSLVAEGLYSLFGEMYVLDEGRTFGPYVTHFQRQYFTRSYNGFSWDLRPEMEEPLRSKVSDMLIARRAEDCIDMPELSENIIHIEPSDKVRKLHDDMYNDLVARCEDEELSAASIGTAIMKCKQITSGAIYEDDVLATPGQALRQGPKSWIEVDDSKLQALSALVEELGGEPLLVGYEFRHELERARKLFGKNLPAISGGMKAGELSSIIQRWNKGEIPLLFAHPKSASHGLNLQNHCGHICWLTCTWSYEEWDQFIHRVYRQGNQYHKVIVHYLLMNETVDELVLKTVKNKMAIQDAFLEAVKGESG